MKRLFFILLLCLFPQSSLAQGADSNSDRDYLTAFLEDNLSDLGRTIRIAGFAGAFSSRATFDELTIADADGVWLAIRKGAISWNRTALLSGRIEINEMSAEEIDLSRSPSASGKTSAEASGFALPELPVAVVINTLRADRVILGHALFGTAAEISLNGRMALEGGDGTADLAINRIDGRRGTFALNGSYSNASRKATLDLLVAEEKDGIAANLIGLPGLPSTELAIHGSGIIDDFRTDIALSTDGQPRLSGNVTLLDAGDVAADIDRRFSAAIAGDITPLLLPEYHAFVGNKVTLEAEGSRATDGQLNLSRLVLGSRGLDVTGRLVVSREGMPLAAALTTRIGLADGGEVLLPLPGEMTYLQNAELTLRYDAARGDEWRLAGSVGGFRRTDFRIARLVLDGAGHIAHSGQAGVSTRGMDGKIAFDAYEIDMADAGIGQAIGPRLLGRTEFSWKDGTPLSLPVFVVEGAGYGIKGDVTIGGPETAIEILGKVTAKVDDMARFSAIVGRPLGGSAALSVDGMLGLLSGIFDLDVSVTGRDLTVAQAELDHLLQGTAEITGSVRRDTDGIEITSLETRAATLRASVSGILKTDASDLAATFGISDLRSLGGTYGGAITAKANVTETAGLREIRVDADATDLVMGQPMVDLVLAGTSRMELSAQETSGKIRLNAFSLSNPQLSVDGTGNLDGDKRDLKLSARLRDMALLAPGFSGPLTVAGTVIETEGGFSLDVKGDGPGGTTAQISGAVAPDFSRTDLRILGKMQSAFFNSFIAPRNIAGEVGFDLTLVGVPELSSLSGQVTLPDARLVAPTFGIDMLNLRARADLGGGQAKLTASADVRGGGQVALSGPVSLSPPYQSELVIDLSNVRLRSPEVYDTSVGGRVSLSGPATGGALVSGTVSLGKTEMRIASTGLGGVADIGDIVHLNEPGPVRRTRARAGLLAKGETAQDRGNPYQLDLAVNAPNQIFVRGRGVDAELGGSLQVGGTTDNILPTGQFNLIRGRLDILGKRLTIDEGLVQLQGALLPYIRFAASSTNDGVTSTVSIDGEVSDPDIRFSSSPELPQEEVIAQLLFGRDLTSLSAFQAVQLTSAIASLAGRGGEGIVSRLRSSFGLDDLDVTTSESGTTEIKVGKYISEKLYSDVTIGSEGKSEINLNLDVRPELTLRGTLGSDGGTGIGVFFERDY